MFLLQVWLVRLTIVLLSFTAVAAAVKTRTIYSVLFAAAILLTGCGAVMHHLATSVITFEDVQHGVEIPFREPHLTISRICFVLGALSAWGGCGTLLMRLWQRHE